MVSRREYTERCVARAREHLDAGDPALAMSSFTSDMLKEESTAEVMRNPAIAALTGLALMQGVQNNIAGVRSYIEGFV